MEDTERKKRKMIHTRTKSAPLLELNDKEVVKFLMSEVNSMYCDSLFEDDDEPFDQSTE